MKNQLKPTIVVFCCILIGMFAGGADGQTTRPVAAISHIVIISIDGCRPDLLLRADTPVIHGLLPHASFTFWARTTAESVTLPSHTSMLTGVVPIKHGIQWNADLPLLHPVYPNYPTLFQLAKKAGYTTAMAAGKSKFVTLAVPGSLDEQFVTDQGHIEDPQVTDQAVGFIHDHQPQVLFVHPPSNDNVGHAKGWGTPQQLAVLATADACVGRVVKAVEDAKLTDSHRVHHQRRSRRVWPAAWAGRSSVQVYSVDLLRAGDSAESGSDHAGFKQHRVGGNRYRGYVLHGVLSAGDSD